MKVQKYPIALRLSPDWPNGGNRLACYRIAGRLVFCDDHLSELEPYRSGEECTVLREVDVTAAGTGATRTYLGLGWIGNRWRRVECHGDPAGYSLQVEGAGRFWVPAAGDAAFLTGAEPAAENEALVESLLGPVLVLALALQGTWCLHASAIMAGGRAVAFVGESGNGKSTLSAFLDADADQPRRRLADDVLPVELSPAGTDALPHFPQLKLPPDCQPATGAPERLPLAAVYVLEPPQPDQDGVRIQTLSAAGATLALVRHTVASRLFDSTLLTRHLDACARIAAHVPVRSLSYPRLFDDLPKVRDAFLVDLAHVR